MQNTLLAIGIALIAAILAAFVGPWFVDWNRHKPLVEAEATRLFGAPVRIAGPLSVRLLPSIAIDAEDVIVGGQGPGRARIGRLRGELRIAPLLRGEAVLNSLAIRDADLKVASGAVPARLIAAEDVQIHNARLAIVEPTGTETLVAERIILAGEARGARGPVRLEGRAAIAERTVAVHALASLEDSGALSLRLRARDAAGSLAVEAEGTARLADRPRFDGAIVVTGQSGRLPWRVAGTGSATTEAVVFERAEAQAGSGERVARANGSLRYAWGMPGAVEAIVAARQIDLDRLAGTGAQGATPRDRLAALVAEVPALAGTDLPITLGLDINGVTLGGALITDIAGDLVSGPGGWTAQRLTARLPGEAAAEMAGRIALRPDLAFHGRLSLTAARPGALLSWLDGQPTPPGTLDDPLRLAARVEAEPGRLVLDGLEAETTAGKAQGRIALDMPALGRHALQLRLFAGSLDLDLLARLARGAGARLDPATDIRLDLRAGEARLAGFVARGLDLGLVSDGRIFEAQRLKVDDLAGLGLDLTGRLDGIGGPLVGRLAGRATARDVNGLLALLSRSPRAAEAARWIAARAGALADADLAVSLVAGRGRAVSFVADGRLGETRMHLSLAGSGDLADPLRLTGTARLTLDDSRIDRLVTLVTGLAPAGLPVPAPSRVALGLRRGGDGIVRLEGEAASADTRLAVEGEHRPDGTASATARLRSPDLAGLLPLIGLPVGLAGAVPADLAAQVRLDGGRWSLQTRGGQVGGAELAADLSGDSGRAEGRVDIASLPVEALLALLTGPSWLIQAEAGKLPEAGFGVPPLAAIGADLTLSIGRIGFDGLPALTGFTARLTREGGRTALADIAARMGPARLAGEARLDRSLASLLLSARARIEDVPLALALPGARSGTAALALDLSGEGASPAALVASLRGQGRFHTSAAEAAGLDPAALATVTRQAEMAQDLGRPMTDAAFDEALERLIARPLAIAPAQGGATLSGPLLRLAETVLQLPGGEVAWSAAIDLADATLAARARIQPAPIAGAETMPFIGILWQGPLGAPQRQLETDDVSGWLGLRLVDRATLGIIMSESDRLERARQRAFSRFTARPPPPIVVPLPPMTFELPPELLPPSVPPAASPAPAAPGPEAPREAAPVPQPRPAEPRPGPRAAAPAQPDLSAVVRRALDGSRPPLPPPGTPLSILPPLPPPIEVGPGR